MDIHTQDMFAIFAGSPTIYLVAGSPLDDVCSYQFRPRSSDKKKSVRVSALYLRRKRNLLYPLYIDKIKNIKPIKSKNISLVSSLNGL